MSSPPFLRRLFLTLASLAVLSTHVVSQPLILVPSPLKGRFPMLNFTQKLQSNKICLDVLELGREHRSLGTFQPFSWSIVCCPDSPHNQLTQLITDLSHNTLIAGGSLTPLTPLPMQEMKPSMFSPIIPDSSAPFNTGDYNKFGFLCLTWICPA